MGEAKRRRDAVARGNPDPMPDKAGIRSPGRRAMQRKAPVNEDRDDMLYDEYGGASDPWAD
jgi:hypothetical protein